MKKKRNETDEQFAARVQRKAELNAKFAELAKQQRIVDGQKRQRFIDKWGAIYKTLFPLATDESAKEIFGSIYDHDIEAEQAFQFTNAFSNNKKRKRSVMFDGSMSRERKVFCAVVAYLRHNETGYDENLMQVVEDDKSVEQVRQEHNEKIRPILEKWGFVGEVQ